MRALTAVAILAGALAAPAFAHGGHDHAPAAGALAWTWDPWITVPIALSGAAFAIGWWRLRARSGPGAAAVRRRAMLFAGGWLMLAGALVSPLHAAGERSFTAHMIEHELLMIAAAPLLVLAEPLAVMLWAFPREMRRAIGTVAAAPPVAGVWGWLSAPIAATVAQAVALWIWHAPFLFDRALASDGWHAAQHLSFVVTALAFWTAMLGRRGARATAPAARGLAALCLFATSMVSGALGALMAVSESPWYAGYARLGMAPFGLTPAEDQQMAGLIMWIPGGIVHAAAALLLARGLLRKEPLRAV